MTAATRSRAMVRRRCGFEFMTSCSVVRVGRGACVWRGRERQRARCPRSCLATLSVRPGAKRNDLARDSRCRCSPGHSRPASRTRRVANAAVGDALDAAGAQARARTPSSRNPARLAIRSVGWPCSTSHRCSESAPRCFCTTRTAVPSGVEPAEPAQQQVVQGRLADADRRVRPDEVEPDVVGHRRRGDATCTFVSAVAGGVGGGEVARPLVHVDRPHRGSRGPLRRA